MDVVLDELLPVVLIELFERIKLRVIEFLLTQFTDRYDQDDMTLGLYK
ncbi:MAG: hypothetical protein CM15mV3_1450 [Caudoviricetes sp.]|nr:MAG: hypothetical protein CM15mV3_1450 [Caudoviricetes sp.]